jgi:hypothetical protein
VSALKLVILKDVHGTWERDKKKEMFVDKMSTNVDSNIERPV